MSDQRSTSLPEEPPYSLPLSSARARNVRSCRAASLLSGLFRRALRTPDEFSILPVLRVQLPATVNVLLCSGPDSSTRTYAGCGRLEPCTASNQCRLEVGDRQHATATFHPLQFRRNHIAENKLARRFKAAIEINRRQNGLERIHEQRKSPAPAATFSSPRPSRR